MRSTHAEVVAGIVSASFGSRIVAAYRALRAKAMLPGWF
jgi:hypothetical protein